MSFFSKLSKALKATVKLNVSIAVQAVTLSCDDLVYFMPQIQRGEQGATDLRCFGIKAQEMKSSRVGGESCRTEVQSKIYIDGGAPIPKTCQIRFIMTNNQGVGDTVVAEKEINLENHFGAEFSEQVYDLNIVPSDCPAKMQSFRVKVEFSC